jgi:CubicO group peptidase (beta-lactamase class C family)
MTRKMVAVLALCVALFPFSCQRDRKTTKPVAIESAELQSFADTFFPGKMEELNIPGLTFIFVQSGEVVFAKGYGYANLESATPVSADSSVVRIGSVSKLFVATAVMQLVEQGRVDLNADINPYLSAFKLENTFSEPVTLAHLLTHTAGFEDPLYVSNTDPALVEPLGEHLAEHMPPRTHPPGEAHIYSNYGYALAALVVEEVSGTPFDKYVEQHIFEPLRMSKSSYLLAPPVPENMVTGYAYHDASQVPQPMDYDRDYPGGSIVSTAEDMSHFVLAHLQDGCHEGACILSAETLAEMHQRQAATPHEGQNVTLGFVEGLQDGQRLLGHSGAIRGFGSSLNLLPEHDAGYFFCFNAECYETSACEIISAFREQFLEQFFQ